MHRLPEGYANEACTDAWELDFQFLIASVNSVIRRQQSCFVPKKCNLDAEDEQGRSKRLRARMPEIQGVNNTSTELALWSSSQRVG
jgi:hypothetical protein